MGGDPAVGAPGPVGTRSGGSDGPVVTTAVTCVGDGVGCVCDQSVRLTGDQSYPGIQMLRLRKYRSTRCLGMPP